MLTAILTYLAIDAVLSVITLGVAVYVFRKRGDYIRNMLRNWLGVKDPEVTPADFDRNGAYLWSYEKYEGHIEDEEDADEDDLPEDPGEFDDEKFDMEKTVETQAKQLRKMGWPNEADQVEKMVARNKRRLAREEKKVKTETP
jgi:hypothetical protein